VIAGDYSGNRGGMVDWARLGTVLYGIGRLADRREGTLSHASEAADRHPVSPGHLVSRHVYPLARPSVMHTTY
jgi:hypothetical protein